MIARLLLFATQQALPAPDYHEAVRCSGLLLASAKHSGQVESRQGAAFDAALLWSKAANAAGKREGISDERVTRDTKSYYDGALERLRGVEVHVSIYIDSCMRRVPRREN